MSDQKPLVWDGAWAAVEWALQELDWFAAHKKDLGAYAVAVAGEERLSWAQHLENDLKDVRTAINAARLAEKNATSGATPVSEDSVNINSESSRPQGLQKEPPHCPSCDCETPSELDQIRQNDKEDMRVAWISDSMKRANANRHWLLWEVDRLRTELKRAGDKLWISGAEYRRLTRRDEILDQIEAVVDSSEDTFGT